MPGKISTSFERCGIAVFRIPALLWPGEFHAGCAAF
jgi:hypothetical protein